MRQEAKKNKKTTELGLEAGMTTTTMEGLAGIANIKTEETDDTIDSRSTSSGTGIVLEGSILNPQKQPKFGARFSYLPLSEKDASSSSKSSLIQITALMSIYF